MVTVALGIENTPEPLTFVRWQELTGQTAKYTNEPRNLWPAILRRGAAEETCELNEALNVPPTTPEAHHPQRQGEIGDVLWYVGRFPHVFPDYFDAAAEEILDGADDFDTFQQRKDHTLLPIINLRGEALRLEDDPRAALAITALRAIDVVNPKTAELWRDINNRPSLGRALADLVKALSYVASKDDISLSGAGRYTIDKINNRARSPKVMAEARARQLLESGRGRLLHWTDSIISEAVRKQVDVSLPHPKIGKE